MQRDAPLRVGESAGRLAIAYIVKAWPRLSETFILNEIVGLERRGVSICIFSVKDPNPGPIHDGVALVRANVTYLSPRSHWKSALPANFRSLRRRPGRYLRTLFMAIVKVLSHRRQLIAARAARSGRPTPSSGSRLLGGCAVRPGGDSSPCAFRFVTGAGGAAHVANHRFALYAHGARQGYLREPSRRSPCQVPRGSRGRHLHRVQPATPAAPLSAGMRWQGIPRLSRTRPCAAPPRLIAHARAGGSGDTVRRQVGREEGFGRPACGGRYPAAPGAPTEVGDHWHGAAAGAAQSPGEAPRSGGSSEAAGRSTVRGGLSRLPASLRVCAPLPGRCGW